MSRINPKTKLFYVFIADFDVIKFASTRPNLIRSFQTNRCLSKFLPQLHQLAEKNLYNLGDEYNRPHFCSIALISIIFYPEQRHRKFIYYNSFGCDKNQKPFNLMPCKCQNYWIRCICYALNGVENIRMTKTISKAKGFKSTMVLGVRSFFLNCFVLDWEVQIFLRASQKFLLLLHIFLFFCNILTVESSRLNRSPSPKLPFLFFKHFYIWLF